MRNYFLLPDSKIKCFLCKKIHNYQIVQIIGREIEGKFAQFECDYYDFSLEVRFNYHNKMLRELEIQDENCGILRLSNISVASPVYIQKDDFYKVSSKLCSPLFVNDLEEILGSFLKEVKVIDYESLLG